MDSFDIAKFSNGYAGCPAFLNQGKPLFGAKFISCHVFCNKGKWGFYALQDGVGRMLTLHRVAAHIKGTGNGIDLHALLV